MLLGASVPPLAAQRAVFVAPAPDPPTLVAEFWTELDPLVPDFGERPASREAAVARLLEEARVVFSGMAYGYRFRYVPGDPARSIPEEFSAEPHALITWGDPRLTVYQTWVDDDRLYARITYSVPRELASWVTAWRSAANPRSTGVGTAPFIFGPESKPDALVDGIRAAVREHVRRQEFNRPALIEGVVVLADAPVVVVRSGNYQARVSVLLQIDRIERYRVY